MVVVEMRYLRKLKARRRLFYGAIGATLCILAVAGIGVASGSGGTSAPFQPPTSVSGDLATAPDATDVAAFSIMQRPRTSTDDISSRAIGGLSSATGANISLSRRAYGFSNGEAWVIPGIGNVCLWAESTTAQN